MVDPSFRSPDQPAGLDGLQPTQLLDTPLEARFERLTRLAQRLLRMSIAAISLSDSERRWVKTAPGLDAKEISQRFSFPGQSALGDDLFIVPDARRDSRFANNPLACGDPAFVFFAGIPIRGIGGTRVGVLCVIDRVSRELTEEEIETLRDLAALAEIEMSISMEKAVQADLLEQLASERRRALVDPLCRVWNRAGINELLDRDHERAIRDHESVALMMIDLDHFKRINDTYGHGVGDDVLRECAKRMLEAVRGVDAVGRYGGEEFTIVPGRHAGLDEIMQVAERIRARVADRPVLTEFGAIPVTISIGVVFADSAASISVADLIALADDALYGAKGTGRNRVVCQTYAAEVPAA